MNITANTARMGTEVIMDGCIMSENLSRMGRNEAWLKKQLKSQGYKDAKAIFLGIYHSEDETLSFYPHD